MRCVHPVECYRKFGGGITWSRADSTGLPAQIRCGQCIGCRLYRSREWAVRMMHEVQSLREAGSMFLTLTYEDGSVPSDGSLDRGEFPRFAKRLRKRVGAFRYFHCGEYGEDNNRPHYHAAVFGYRDPDLYRWSASGSGFDLLRSPVVEAAWQLGHVVVGEMDFASAQYVAGYVTKKLQVSKMSSERDYRRWANRYRRVDSSTGEIVEVEPEFATASNRPGLGARWLRRFHKEVYPADEVVMEGQAMPPPRYYDKLYESWFPDRFAAVKRKRLDDRDRQDDCPERLLSMEKVALARTNLSGGRTV